MSVRKRTWVSGGEEKSAWIVDYFDQEGVRRQETFTRKKEAEARWIEVGHELREGTHTARAASITVEEAAELGSRPASSTATSARPSSCTRATSITTSSRCSAGPSSPT